jgi:hypothetical protein
MRPIGKSAYYLFQHSGPFVETVSLATFAMSSALIASVAFEIDYGRPDPAINPNSCKVMMKVPRGYVALDEVSVTPGIHVVPGSLLLRGASKIAGRDLVDLIETRCLRATS